MNRPHLDDLFSFIRFPSVSTEPRHAGDVAKCADWLVDLGPEGGEGGGRIVAEGTPEQVAKVRGSHTGEALRASRM